MVPIDVVISSAELATVCTLVLAWLAALATALALALVSLAACDSVSALLFKPDRGRSDAADDIGDEVVEVPDLLVEISGTLALTLGFAAIRARSGAAVRYRWS